MLITVTQTRIQTHRHTNTHTHTHTHTHTNTHTHRPYAKNVFLGFRGPQNVCLLRKFDPKTIFSLLIGKRKKKGLSQSVL